MLHVANYKLGWKVLFNLELFSYFYLNCVQEDCLRFKHPFNDPTELDIEEANIELNLLDEDEDDEFVSVDKKK